jgi:hypothetical protein
MVLWDASARWFCSLRALLSLHAASWTTLMLQ